MRKKNSRLSVKKVIGYFLGFIVFGLIIYLGGAKAIKATLSPHVGYLFFSFISTLAVFIVSSLRWGFIIDAIENRRVCSRFDYFLYFIFGRFTGDYLSRVGGDFILRSAALKKLQGVDLKVGISSGFLDKFLDLLFVLILIIPALLYLFGTLSRAATLMIIGVLVVILFTFFFYRNTVFCFLLKKLFLGLFKKMQAVRWMRGWIKKEHIQVVEDLENLEVFKRNALLFLIGITAIKYVFLVLRVYFLTAALGLRIPLFVLFIGIPIVQLGLALAITPGALGVLEGGWYSVLALSGISKVEVATFLIGLRAYWFIFTGVTFLAMYLLAGVSKAQVSLIGIKERA